MNENEFNEINYKTALYLSILLGVLTKDSFGLSSVMTGNMSKKTLLTYLDYITHTFVDIFPDFLKCNQDKTLSAIDKSKLNVFISKLVDNWGFNYFVLKEDFLKNFDRAIPPKLYKITDYKYVPFVLMEYIKNKSFVKDIFVVINDILLYLNSYSVKDRIYFEITVDISTLLDNIAKNKSKSSNLKKERTKKYSDTQEKIYLYLNKWVKEYNSFGIDYYTLRNYIKKFTSDVSKALCELNKKYMAINNTKEKLIKFDRSLDQYIINKAIV